MIKEVPIIMIIIQCGNTIVKGTSLKYKTHTGTYSCWALYKVNGKLWNLTKVKLQILVMS